MKCSQCGCNDLVEVEFPQETTLIECERGLVGYSSSYDIESEVYCKTYICVNCGHFEFFDLELAEQIKNDRKEKAEAKEYIIRVEKEIVDLSNQVSDIQKEKEKLINESQDLDITIRKSNEIKMSIKDLENEIITLHKTIKEKEKEVAELKNKLNK